MKLLLPIFALLPLCLAMPGCGPFWVDPYITVQESHLNWIEIHYYTNINSQPVKRTSVFINGAGHVEVRKGTSELVSNDFAKRNNSSEWAKIRTQRKTADPKHVNDIFQHLVNHGLLDREKNFKAAKNPRKDAFLAVKANISNYTYSERDNIFEVDPDLAEQLLDVVREFENPAR